MTTRRRRRSPAEQRERRAAVEDPAVVLDAAARFLEARSRSVTEVRRRLTMAGYRAELIDGAIARLTDLGMLDDEAFARAWVESRDRARPRGERALRDELRLKGIDRSLVDRVLEDRRTTAEDASPPDRTAAERLIEKHARALDRIIDPRRRRERAYALLARNGFDPETCREIAARVARQGEELDAFPA
ncbi:MAG TPA: regulatory protein RecX [Candidatus Limnocylindrales bacterium]|nr:regulatory protein RecX [Candidatus Limnocylindrales bacterium]